MKFGTLEEAYGMSPQVAPRGEQAARVAGTSSRAFMPHPSNLSAFSEVETP